MDYRRQRMNCVGAAQAFKLTCQYREFHLYPMNTGYARPYWGYLVLGYPIYPHLCPHYWGYTGIL